MDQKYYEELKASIRDFASDKAKRYLKLSFKKDRTGLRVSVKPYEYLEELKKHLLKEFEEFFEDTKMDSLNNGILEFSGYKEPTDEDE